MSITVKITIQEFAYGNPGSLGEPRGLWSGEADVTGDASGGSVLVDFSPENPIDVAGGADHRREYVYFVDNLMAIATPSDPGNMGAVIEMHMARANSALGVRSQWRTTVATLSNGSQFAPITPLMPESIQRMPVFWDTQELEVGTRIIVDLFAQLNVLANTYLFRCNGRYYDRQVLFNRSFGRLVSPPPVAPFG